MIAKADGGSTRVLYRISSARSLFMDLNHGVGFTSQAFVEQELDADEDGQVTAQDIVTFLQAQWVCSSRPGHPGALEGGSHRHAHWRRQTPQQAGLVATRKLPRGLQAKLLAAAG